MSTIQIKTEIQQMIEREIDVRVLEAIHTILQTSLDPVLKDKLTSRAIQSERDIASGNILIQEEIVRITNRY